MPGAADEQMVCQVSLSMFRPSSEWRSLTYTAILTHWVHPASSSSAQALNNAGPFVSGSATIDSWASGVSVLRGVSLSLYRPFAPSDIAGAMEGCDSARYMRLPAQMRVSVSVAPSTSLVCRPCQAMVKDHVHGTREVRHRMFASTLGVPQGPLLPGVR